MSKQPDNSSNKSNPVGRFMVAVGAMIELRETGKILINQRSAHLDWHPNDWEIIYGRIDQFEGLENGLRREVKEEVGIDDLEIITVLRAWRIFRGSEQSAENELIGITYRCRTQTEAIKLSKEHQNYQWVTPQEALKIVSESGIRQDIERFIKG